MSGISGGDNKPLKKIPLNRELKDDPVLKKDNGVTKRKIVTIHIPGK